MLDGSPLEAVRLCLELGNDVNAVNTAGETALHGAVYRAAPEDADALIRFLVDKGAQLNVKTRRGWTPLVIAEGIFTSSDIRSPKAAALLRELGAEPSPPDVIRVTSTADVVIEDQARQKR